VSPTDLCSRATKLIFQQMRNKKVKRFVYCSGASANTQFDQITLGSKILKWMGEKLMPHLALDKVTQYEYLLKQHDIDWIGVRPAVLKKGKQTNQFRFGFDQYWAFSSITFADCASQMLELMTGDEWVHKAAVIQY